jgi:hypothetical protein
MLLSWHLKPSENLPELFQFLPYTMQLARHFLIV